VGIQLNPATLGRDGLRNDHTRTEASDTDSLPPPTTCHPPLGSQVAPPFTSQKPVRCRDFLNVGDHDDFLDELAGFLDDDDRDEPPVPTWRATIRRGTLMLTNWEPFLIGPGPFASQFSGRERVGITIADLTLHGQEGEEVSVRYWATGTGREQADEALVNWAADVGHKRVWLPDRLVEIEPDPDRIETETVHCPTCRARWSDSTPEFWLTVRRGGAFPKWCPICGCELPQWSVGAKPVTPAEPRDVDAWNPAAARRDRSTHKGV